VLAVPGVLFWIFWSRRINRMSADEQQELSKRWGNGRGGCGGGG